MLTKFMKSVFILLLASTLFVSCSKEDTATKEPVTITGKWVGKYGYGNDDPSYYYCFNIKQDGTFQEMSKSGNILGTGTWELTGDVFTATVTWDPPYSSTFMVTATFEATKAKLSGVWGYAPSDSDGGEWYLDKQ